ncbi:MAG: Lrp/AsnC family transcriptional regulator [Candidatus Diapherotrites archaeon]|uniref:Lrp/AsnC family transcriptional regulator n=1 Tax=Candidatus Iainarchaeum sp. TaxID=3101447 RepID=A0A8T3YMS5_9ARCH|nr:Lrp/AsnC family transcriptional regulator [Candidatus Diapherotrites archaeon]
MAENGAIALGLKDRKILYELDINARAPLALIGRKVGLSKEVVNYRINRLLGAGVIKGFYARIETSALGFTLFRTFLRMQNLSPGKEKEFIRFVDSCPSIGFFVRVEGNYDFNFIYWSKGARQYWDFWEELNAKFGRYIEKKELNLLEYYANFPKAFLVGRKDTSAKFFECGLQGKKDIDATDYRLLKILSTWARKPLVEIAKELGVSDKVVAYRIKRLEESGIIHSYGVRLHLGKIGLHYYKLHLFLKDFSKERFSRLMSFAAGHPNVIYIDRSLGGPDFEIELYMKEKAEYYAFLSELRYKFSDIIRDFETLYYPEEFKLVLFPWGDGNPLAQGQARA